jgi:hypothetical protein
VSRVPRVDEGERLDELQLGGGFPSVGTDDHTIMMIWEDLKPARIGKYRCASKLCARITVYGQQQHSYTSIVTIQGSSRFTEQKK